MSNTLSILANYMMKLLWNKIMLTFIVCYVCCDNALNKSMSMKENEESKSSGELYRRLFKLRRVDHKNAVQNILKMNNYEKQYNMVKIVTNQLFNTLRNSRVTLESSGYVPGFSVFPTNKTTLEALSSILENTALFGEIILHLPDITQHLLFFNNHWKVLYEWCLGFANESRNLLDNSTMKLFSLVLQELYPDKRSESYVNPYWKQDAKTNFNLENRTEKPKVKKKLKKGPRLYNEL